MNYFAFDSKMLLHVNLCLARIKRSQVDLRKLIVVSNIDYLIIVVAA